MSYKYINFTDLLHTDEVYEISSKSLNKSYNYQKSFIASIFRDDTLLNLSTNEYHAFILDNRDFINNNLPALFSYFKNYLDNQYNSRFIIKYNYLYDSSTNILMDNAFTCSRPVLRFFENYKQKCMAKVLMFSNILNSYGFNNLDNEFKDILNNGFLFLTITMKPDTPLNTALSYKYNWKNFYNHFRQILKRNYNIDLKYYIKGVEQTKDNKTHVHLVILDVNINPAILPKLKKDFEHALKTADFGYVNDITYINKNKTYRFILNSKYNQFKKDNSKYFSSISVLKDVNYDYFDYRDNILKTSHFKFIKCVYSPTDTTYKINQSTKILNYVFKYPLKFSSYDKLLNSSELSEDEQSHYINKFIEYNSIYWLLGIKRFEFSRSLSSLLKKYNPPKRFYCFNTLDDVINFINKYEYVKGGCVCFMALGSCVSSLGSVPSVADCFKSLGVPPSLIPKFLYTTYALSIKPLYPI